MAMVAVGTRVLIAPASAIIRTILYPEIAGVAVLWIGMWYFWFGFDSSHYFKKAIWFVGLFFLVPLGTISYYFVVYRRCVLIQSKGSILNAPE